MASQLVNRMREEFQSCPGCGRNRDQIYRQRPNEAMHMNQCLTVEHLRARSHGGTNDPHNLLIVCHRCNFGRGNQTPWDWFGAQHLIFQDGWPCPPEFYGRAGRENRRIWRNRAAAIAALLGHGPVTFEGPVEHLPAP